MLSWIYTKSYCLEGLQCNRLSHIFLTEPLGRLSPTLCGCIIPHIHFSSSCFGAIQILSVTSLVHVSLSPYRILDKDSLLHKCQCCLTYSCWTWFSGTFCHLSRSHKQAQTYAVHLYSLNRVVLFHGGPWDCMTLFNLCRTVQSSFLKLNHFGELCECLLGRHLRGGTKWHRQP